MNLEYAEMFSADYCSGGYSVVTIADGRKYLIVPEGMEAPSGIGGEYTIIKQPVERIYNAASSSADLFDGLGSLGNIRAVSSKAHEWALDNVRSAMEKGDILYAGKYSAPDYELIISEGCSLAIESTMIYHSPEIMEQLEAQSIPVLAERSSYEPHPLGRMEWIKLYGLILGKEAEAERIFSEKSAVLNDILTEEKTGRTAAFFYIGSNGSVNVRKPGDYISKMIELAGGEYILTADDLNVEENALSTMNMQFEAFYAMAMDADYLIYNSTIDGGIASVEKLIEKNPLLADFKAVKNGNVWCTEKNMFQQSTGAADMIKELHYIFTDNTDEQFEYLYHLEREGK